MQKKNKSPIRKTNLEKKRKTSKSKAYQDLVTSGKGVIMTRMDAGGCLESGKHPSLLEIKCVIRLAEIKERNREIDAWG